MIKKLLALGAALLATVTMAAATFSSQLGIMTVVGWHYDVYEDLGDIGMYPVGSQGDGSSMLLDGEGLYLNDGYYWVESGLGWTRYFTAWLEIDYQYEVDLWVDFEEDIPNSTVQGEWSPSEHSYYVDEWVDQTRTVQKRVNKGKRYNGYEKDVSEQTVYDWEFRRVQGTMLRP